MKLSHALTRWIEGRVAAVAVTLLTLGFWFEMASFPHFFFFNPLETSDPILRIEHVFFTLGWILFATVPIVSVWLPAKSERIAKVAYLLAASFWPLSILIIQLTLAFKGLGFYEYLETYPISAFFDIFVPAYFLAVFTAIWEQ